MSEQKPKITVEFLKQNPRVLFHPKTEDEARWAQDRLFDLGVVWAQAGRQYAAVAILAARGTLIVNDEKIDMKMRYGTERFYNGTVCDISQLSSDYAAPETREERLERQFNELSKKVDRLTLILERIEAEIIPDHKLDKSALKR